MIMKYLFKMENISEAMSICIKNGIYVYPIKANGCWNIQVVNKKKINTFSKKLYSNKEVNDAVVITYIHYFKKLKKE
tara:strand:+ start:663 stop:893 length:231 start_codon:yes stop_codon:yes gene_type:complete